MEFNKEETIKHIENYANVMFETSDEDFRPFKPFYHFNEWSGWRFYLKAIRYRDWASIKGHIRDLLTNDK